ncbi:hypothetical protein B0H11DRAFT_2265744 [Mycena galericulata]|nr:hypothetical protein B0H11DRAFT_2265741 [Mycena galericulata]KAJ7429426.1 hypothetical protein B0H11DRAFT_2265744 [Mycena galericulata]
MNSIPVLSSAPTDNAFNISVPPPPPLVVLLADSDVTHPQLPRLLAESDIHRPAVGPRSRGITPRPRSRANTPYPTTSQRAQVKAKNSPTPSRRATSPLTSEASEDDYGYPPLPTPKAQRVLIPRPKGVQKAAEKSITLEKGLLPRLKTRLGKLATENLELTEPLGQQDQAAMDAFRAAMHTEFPCLLDYEGDWVLSCLTTTFLKNAKAQLKIRKDRRRLADVSAAVGKS